MPPPLPRSVKLLGLASLLTDLATEAIYPLLPLFVTRVLGGSVVALGVIEGAADAVSSLLKVVAGRASDRAERRKPFVIVGYAIASLARPFIAAATIWQHVFAVRLIDRVGKGLRGAPRDAMLAALAPAGQRGRIFGYHRAMDHTGAVIGPLVAAGFLWVFPDQYRTLFALTIVPGVLAVITLTFVHEPAVPPMRQTKTKTHDIKHEAPDARVERQPVGLGSPLGRYLLILAVFTIGNSTDAFLLLRLSDAGLAAVFLPLAWSALHVVKSSLSTLGGTLSDRVGRRRMIVAGWLFYAVVYVGFALADSLAALLVWLGLYGLHFAMVEGSEKALVADLTPHHLQGTAFGWYNAMLGVGALAASVLFGVLWERFGPPAAFLTGAGLAIIASVLLAMDSRLGAPAAQRASV